MATVDFNNELITDDDTCADSSVNEEDSVNINTVYEKIMNIYLGIDDVDDLPKEYIKELGFFMNLYKNKHSSEYLEVKAIMFMYGIYYNKNIYEAIECFKTAHNYSSFAMNALGDIYTNFEDTEKAIYYYSLSANEGNSEGMFGLALLYKNSEKFRDIEKSIYWYNQILDQETDARAMRSLYYIYKDQKNYDLAIHYLKLIQDHTNNHECKNCAFRYKDIQKDIDECIRLSKTIKKLDTIYTDIRSDSCSICLNKLIGTPSPILTLVCGHSFHNKCIDGIKEPKVCPVCREEL